MSNEDMKKLRRAAEDARDACNRHYGPFIDVVAHPLRILALLDRVQTDSAEIARLSAALSEALAQLEAERARNAATWLPMDTAPKNGTEVLLDLPLGKSRARRAVIGHYMEGGHCIEDHPAIDRGWYFWTGHLFDKAPDPIGWMPLPSSLAIIPGDAS